MILCVYMIYIILLWNMQAKDFAVVVVSFVFVGVWSDVYVVFLVQ